MDKPGNDTYLRFDVGISDKNVEDSRFKYDSENLCEAGER
jgi:hypothetical protein